MNKNKSLFQKVIKTKRFLYLSIIVSIAIFALIFNYAYAAFLSANTEELLNTEVAELKYAYAINEKATQILKLEPNETKAFDLIIKSLEEIDTKYEIIYKRCKNGLCNYFEDKNENVSIYISNKSEHDITGIIKKEEVKRIRLVAVNNLNDEIYIKFDINSGFVHNTLELKKDITKEFDDDFILTKILLNYDNNNNIKEAEKEIFKDISTDEENNLYKINDDDGISYYFRGAKNYINNNIIFGDHLWKIVRINGDESVRIIYVGKCIDENCDEKNNLISSFNENNKNDYENSTVKEKLDSWYEENILEKEYESFIYDTKFCYDIEGNKVDGEIVFNAYERLINLKAPSLKCNHPYSVKNENLKYPIGLLNADEAAYAGFKYNSSNENNYLKTDYNWWLLSPYNYEDEIYSIMYIDKNGSLLKEEANTENYLRPVLNLKPGIKVTGNGLLSDPFKLKT